MKTLLKSIMVAIVAILFIASVKAQIPDRFKNLPIFKMRGLGQSSQKSQTPCRLNDRQCSPNAPCLNAQATLGGSNYDQGSKIIQTRDGGFAVCGLTFSAD